MIQPDAHSQTGSLWEEYAVYDIAEVVVDVEAPDLAPTYSYLIPESLRNQLKVGHCVHVSFAGREVLGYVLERKTLPQDDPLCAKLKPILGIVPEAISITAEQIALARWMEEHYVCSLQDALRCVAPNALGARLTIKVRLRDPNLRGRDLGKAVKQAHLIETLYSLGGEAELEELRKAAALDDFRTVYKTLLSKQLLLEKREIVRSGTALQKIKLYSLGPAAEVIGLAGLGRRSPQQQQILHVLQENTRAGQAEMTAAEIIEGSGASYASLRALVKQGILSVRETTRYRLPYKATSRRTAPPSLTQSQQQATQRIRSFLQSRSPKTLLLFGVTASGKTEVYLDAISYTLSQGLNALVLLPEIALTTQVADTFIGRFGEQVALLHSRLSEGERYDEWRRVQSGEAHIVIGARSAIFAPLQNIGLIIMDEEHEPSYKQEKVPRYSTRALAEERAQYNNAVLLLGSATPALESFYASECGTIERIEMLERVDNRPLPHVHIVDMRQEFQKKPTLFAQPLVEAIADRLSRREQVILFLNRRGYSQFVLCRDCGWTARCPNCAISLAFHLADRSLKCHHCNYLSSAPLLCPQCGGNRVKGFGLGTERVEEEALLRFPQARIARLDRDTTTRKEAHARIVRDFRQGEADILIGTQMVAKGLDFPKVTLVGVINADTAINMPDFRAAERTFQLLTQVAGRAGRGDIAGEVIIQTFCPEHYAIQAASRHDYIAFYRQELIYRKELCYPPFSRLANLICASTNEEVAASGAERLAAVLARLRPASVEIIGPAPASIPKLKTQFRHHVVLRTSVEFPLHLLIRQALDSLPSSLRPLIMVDIDPISMA
ncbi:replication restart DNA helicase PriA [Chthonomonas calidirosea]|uniref:Replication restart protein PriA n=1 Tax=Chthonomonas calidirosea (strain DSM 23976 / ICMP 18418 / T49) TaxID=1303518 RepID=S0ET22_CHTCT|nr:primosomal protein N' [Chthonomonas calidirosea]CCW34484.1 replication restart DNA helicase PriA [Chthonomonas calidirosea T49]CEK14650.1 replication restart DNA helicase PriA [Chthonomonas calidirosea]